VVLEKDWASATDREYRIQGRHSRGYYKQADAWLRNEVEATRIATQDPLAAALRRAAARDARESMLGLAAETEA
jgi:hypothetical protein